MEEDKALEYFKERVTYWLDFFGLYNWEITVHAQDEDEEEDDTLAYTTFTVDNRRADIFLSGNFGETEKSEYELDKTAFHEIVEILLLRVRHLAGKRTYDYTEMDGAIHDIIRILTAKIFEKEVG